MVTIQHVCLSEFLEPIAENYRTVVCPFIDVIDFETFAYRAQDEGARGAFDWEFFYKRLPLLAEDLKHPAEPFRFFLKNHCYCETFFDKMWCFWFVFLHYT
jgi:hypothetical protein